MKSSVTEQGTSASYTLRRLARNHPELLERFAAGELTANQAAIQADFLILRKFDAGADWRDGRAESGSGCSGVIRKSSVHAKN